MNGFELGNLCLSPPFLKKNKKPPHLIHLGQFWNSWHTSEECKGWSVCCVFNESGLWLSSIPLRCGSVKQSCGTLPCAGTAGWNCGWCMWPPWPGFEESSGSCLRPEEVRLPFRWRWADLTETHTCYLHWSFTVVSSCWKFQIFRALTKIGVVSLVEEELVSDALHDDVPGVHWACAAHQRGQDGIGGKDITLSLSQLRGDRFMNDV